MNPYAVVKFVSDSISGFAAMFVTLLGSLSHGWCHKSFQFSPRVFENFFVLFVIWMDKVNSSQSSSIDELRFFFCPFLFFSILSGFTNFRPNFWPYMIWSSPGPPYPFRGFSFNKVNFVKPFRESDTCLLEPTFQ